MGLLPRLPAREVKPLASQFARKRKRKPNHLYRQAMLTKLFSVFLSSIAVAVMGAPRGYSTRRRSLGSSKGSMMMTMMKKKPSTKPRTASLSDPETLCLILETFDNLGRKENNPPAPGLNWDTLCDDFEPLAGILCPDAKDQKDICEHKHPELNPAVKEHYCGPLMDGLVGDRFEECRLYCINYVSNARGGCCEIECDDDDE